MHVSRRSFVVSAAAAAAAALPDTASARADFRASKETYLNTATEHPLGSCSTRAMEEYLRALTQGPDSARQI
jgi:hypothetical protein